MIDRADRRDGAGLNSLEEGQRTVLEELGRTAPADAVRAAIALLDVAVHDQARAPFVTRSLHALTRVAKVSTRQSLLEAASAGSDLVVLLHALNNPYVLTKLGMDDPLITARIRGALAQQRLVSDEGGVCSAEVFGRLLGGLSRQAIDKRRRNGKLIAFDLGRHGYGYPVWQINRGTVLPSLDRVIATLDECDSWTQAGFMLSPSSWLGGQSPLAELRRGEVERVVATAEMLTG